MPSGLPLGPQAAKLPLLQAAKISSGALAISTAATLGETSASGDMDGASIGHSRLDSMSRCYASELWSYADLMHQLRSFSSLSGAGIPKWIVLCSMQGQHAFDSAIMAKGFLLIFHDNTCVGLCSLRQELVCLTF